MSTTRSVYECPPLPPTVVQLTCVSMPATFEQVNRFVPLGLVTCTFSMLMFEHTDGLEQTT